MTTLFHRRLEPHDRLEPVQVDLLLQDECPQRCVLYQPPRARLGHAGERRRALEFEADEVAALFGDDQEAEDPLLIRDRFAERHERLV